MMLKICAYDSLYYSELLHLNWYVVKINWSIPRMQHSHNKETQYLKCNTKIISSHDVYWMVKLNTQ